MPPLAELQQDFARAVLTGEVPPGLFTGRVPAQAALSIHRDTIIGALGHALRLSYPTVEALVGADFFDATARLFAEQNLPRAAALAAYGEGFADFLAAFAPAASLPYLPDVARLDRAVEAALRAPLATRRVVLDAAASLVLPQSLAVLFLMHPADEIRAALGDDDALAAIDLAAAPRAVLVWRTGDEAAVRRVSPASGRFLAALLAGDETAIAQASDAEALAAIQAEIFAAPFCTIIPRTQETSP